MQKSFLYERIEESFDFLWSKTHFKPKVGLILGTGLGAIVDDIDILHSINYCDIPYFPVSTVPSHAGKLIFGYLNNVPVVVMAGRFHYYEGYDTKETTFPVRVIKRLGADGIIISNVSGSVRQEMLPGDIIIIKDHINMLVDNPLRGENDERIGPRFPDMIGVYDQEMINSAIRIAGQHGIRHHTGVYFCTQGPNLETPAEYRMIATLGADCVGMSTVPEVIVARHSGLKVLTLSLVSNCCYPYDEIKRTSLNDILETARKSEPKLRILIHELMADMALANEIGSPD